MNNGQACVAQTRILASRRHYDEVVDALGEAVAGVQVGDPADPATEIGPMVAQRQQERVEKFIALGQEEGARLVAGGTGMPDGLDRGWYVRPTVFADVDIEAGLDVARRVRAGTYGVNTYTMDSAAPLGGFKSSGVGREFGPEGLGQYTELKSIYIELPA